ncbi:anti-sigma factor [Curtobacterium aetherium]|uniref:Anti-sigma factor n=1 Tax=Curtobacterium aetherium TaxID=2841594 RepID=A0ACD1E476_9MICO|nr:anti-sigma factor [Curtobacterium sp. L6-1]QWS33547.1 anti-sigma factor [Curtobacterium sp. L6-1]
MNGRHDDPELMTGSHALDALTDDERAAVERALEDSAELRVEADSLRETALALAFAVSPVEPPASLKSSLMAKIATTPQLPAVDRAETSAPEPVQEARPTSVPDVAPVTDLGSGSGRAASTARARWFQRPSALLSVAAAGAVVFLGVGLGVGNALDGGSGQGPATTQAASGLDQIYASPDFQRSTAKVKGGGTATVVWSGQLGRSAVILDGVDAAPEDKTYELWYIGSQESGGTITAAGLMNDVDGGVRSAVLHGTMGAGDTIGITVEPRGGSEQPTSEPVVAVPTSEA